MGLGLESRSEGYGDLLPSGPQLRGGEEQGDWGRDCREWSDGQSRGQPVQGETVSSYRRRGSWECGSGSVWSMGGLPS